jgi:hypothetical protein
MGSNIKVCQDTKKADQGIQEPIRSSRSLVYALLEEAHPAALFKDGSKQEVRRWMDGSMEAEASILIFSLYVCAIHWIHLMLHL